mmetsp:Transcript_2981/g.6772  ORF Transcript_2981/g.6772 Transcript_2981/m.6772 type:complete len:221 (-) Transcript_2981:107-769(-)
MGQVRKGIHREGCPNDHQQLALAEVQASVPKEGCRQVLPKEDNVRFHQASVLLTQRLPAAWALLSAKHRLAQLLCWHALSVPHAAGRVEAAVCGDQALGGHPSKALETVDVLCEAPQETALPLQRRDESMREGGLVALDTGPKILCQLVESIRGFAKVVQTEDRLRSREVVLLQIIVEPGSGASEVRNAGSGAGPCPCEHDDVSLARRGEDPFREALDAT